MSDISVRSTQTFVPGEDQRWIGPSGIPPQNAAPPRTITLLRSAVLGPAAGGTTFQTQGFVPSGLTLAKITASGLWAPYNNALATGVEVMVGHLFASVALDPFSTGNIVAALYWDGEVIESFLPTGHGLDAAGKTDVKGNIAYI